MPGFPDLQQLVLMVFFIPATSVNLLPALVVVALCNLHWSLPSSTGTYPAFTYCNLHCGGSGGGGGMYVVVLGACRDAHCIGRSFELCVHHLVSKLKCPTTRYSCLVRSRALRSFLQPKMATLQIGICEEVSVQDCGLLLSYQFGYLNQHT